MDHACDYHAIKQFKNDIAMELWAILKERFGGISLAKLRKLTIRFDTYKKLPKT